MYKPAFDFRIFEVNSVFESIVWFLSKELIKVEKNAHVPMGYLLLPIHFFYY